MPACDVITMNGTIDQGLGHGTQYGTEIDMEFRCFIIVFQSCVSDHQGHPVSPSNLRAIWCCHLISNVLLGYPNLLLNSQTDLPLVISSVMSYINRSFDLQ